MIIMSIFLILSVLLIIVTVIYVNKKKEKMNKIDTKENKEKKIKNEKNLSDKIKIKIENNVICLENRYSSILKLGNIDYNMLSIEEQSLIENILIQTALSIDYPIQFFSTTEFVDTNKVIENIRKYVPKNKNIQEYQNNLIKYLQNLMENRTISVIKNYAIISYDGLYENAKEELNRKILSLKNSLIRANISCELLNENELYNLIYQELNKNSNIKIDELKKGVGSLYVGKKQENKKK